MVLAAHDLLLIQCVATPIAAIALLVAYYAFAARAPSSSLVPPPRWSAPNAGKAWSERFFLRYSVVWILFFGCVIVSGAWEHFAHVEYMAVCGAIALPCLLAPALLLAPAPSEARLPLWRRQWFRANAWIAIISYVGNYFWTHYFFTLLGADYTFPSWRLNGVPIPMFLATHAYFCTYHTLTTMALRRWRSGATFRTALPPWLRPLATSALITVMAWLTAFTEAFTIQGFPYYRIRDREYLYTVGSVVYGLYFVVSFPMYARLDEYAEAEGVPAAAAGGEEAAPAAAPRRRRSLSIATRRGALPAALADAPRERAWTLSATCIDSLAACMLVTILLDLWRLGYTAYAGREGGEGGLPWI